MRFFPSKAIVFYPLFAREYDAENLHDFLEDKVCKILNLRRDCEYFLRYFHEESSGYFYCLLLNKEILREEARDFAEFLTHPAFLAQQFLAKERQFFLIAYFYEGLEITLVGYFGGQIVFLQSFKSAQEALEKSQEMQQRYHEAGFCFWDMRGWNLEQNQGENQGRNREQNQTQNLKVNGEWNQEINGVRNQALNGAQNQGQNQAWNPQNHEEFALQESGITWEILNPKLEDLSLEESWNFNPLEKAIPLWRQNVGKILLCGAAGVVCGALYPLVLWVLVFLEGKTHGALNQQIEAQNKALQAQMQSYTAAQKEGVALQEKYQNLERTFSENEKFLQKFLHANPKIMQFFDTIHPLLESQQVKIAYFHAQKGVFEILFAGANAVAFLEILGQEGLADLESLEEVGGFYFVRIRV